MLARVPRSIRLWLAVLSSVVLSVGLVTVATGQAASTHGDCQNDNSGGHNGYVCDGSGSAAGGDSDSPGAGKPVDNTHGDCKNEPDTPGDHNGYVCGSGDTGGGGGGGGGGGAAVTTSTPLLSAPTNTSAQQGVLGEKVRACASRRSLTVHIQRFGGVKFRSAKITFRGKVLASRKGDKNVKAPIVMKGLPRGTFTVHIRVVTVHGKVIKGTRTYHTCVGKRAPHRPPRI